MASNFEIRRRHTVPHSVDVALGFTMSISALSSAASINSSLTTSTARKGALDTDAFLRLMVEQLQNQNPLDPTDSNQMLNQMVSYASYNEHSATRESMSELTALVKSIATSLDIKV
jgi:flagellar basal-body rod modification protein FlgD